MSKKLNGIEVIGSMSREEFHNEIVRVVCKLVEFGHLVSAGAQDLSPYEIQVVRQSLIGAGIPYSVISTDKELDEIAWAIARRSVSLQ